MSYSFLPHDRCIIEYPITAGEVVINTPNRLCKKAVERVCAVLRTLEIKEK